MEQVFIAEKGTSFPSVFVDVENRRFKDGEKDNAKVFARTALPIVANQPPENPVLHAIAALPVVEESDDGLPVWKRGEVRAIGLQPPEELSEFRRIQLLTDSGERKAHASRAAWALVACKVNLTLTHRSTICLKLLTASGLGSKDSRPGTGSSALSNAGGPAWRKNKRAPMP